MVAPPISKVYPVELAEPLEELLAKEPSLDPSIVACFTEEDIRIIKRNIKKLSKWGIANQNTIERINEEAK
jgi:hypothetical protein